MKTLLQIVELAGKIELDCLVDVLHISSDGLNAVALHSLVRPSAHATYNHYICLFHPCT